jgi:hypothetical protein
MGQVVEDFVNQEFCTRFDFEDIVVGKEVEEFTPTSCNFNIASIVSVGSV